MSTKRPIREILNQREKTVTVNTDRDDATTILLYAGDAPGFSRLSVVDVDVRAEEYLIIVRDQPWRGRNGKSSRNRLFLTIGEVYRWQIASKKPIAAIVGDKNGVAAEVDPKNRSVLVITARSVGFSYLIVADKELDDEESVGERVIVYVREKDPPKEK
jgi:hypothetical protein